MFWSWLRLGGNGSFFLWRIGVFIAISFFCLMTHRRGIVSCDAHEISLDHYFAQINVHDGERNYSNQNDFKPIHPWACQSLCGLYEKGRI